MEIGIIGLVVGLLVALVDAFLVRGYYGSKVRLVAVAVHWLAIGGIMPFIDMGVAVWLTGIIVGAVLSLPIIVIAAEASKKAVIHTIVFAPIWGMVISYSCDFFAV